MSDQDTRFCCGTTCTWFGSIYEANDSRRQPRHAHQLQMDIIASFQLRAQGYDETLSRCW